jgi:hypothetical protein
MPQNSFQLRIKNPCNQSWDAMKVLERERFCSLCSKNVIDFTQMSDKDMYSYFKNNTGNVCGKLNTRQLESHFEKPIQTKYRKLVSIISSLVMLTISEESVAKEITNNSIKWESLIQENNPFFASQKEEQQKEDSSKY